MSITAELAPGVNFELFLNALPIVRGKLNEDGSYTLEAGGEAANPQVIDFFITELLISVEVEVPLNYGDNIDSVLFKINRKMIRLPRTVDRVTPPRLPDDSISRFRAELFLSELGLERGNGNPFVFEFAREYENSLNGAITTIDIKDVLEDLELDEEEAADDSHNDEEEQLDPVQKTIEAAEDRAKKGLGLAAEDIVESISSEKSPLKDKVEIQARSGDYLVLKIDSRAFFDGSKRFRDVESAVKSKQGQEFLDFLESKGYEVDSIQRIGKLDRLSVVVKQRKLAVSYKEERKIKSIEALYAFNRVASMLLTEPYLYEDSPRSVHEELKRIQSIFDKSVLPCFYQTLETAACGESHLQAIIDKEFQEEFKNHLSEILSTSLEEAEDEIDSELVENALLTTAGGIVGGIAICFFAPIIIPAAAVGGIGVASGVVIGGGLLSYDLYNSDENIRWNNERIIQGIRALSKYLNGENLLYTKEQVLNASRSAVSFSSNPEADKKQKDVARNILAKAISKTGEGGVEINGAINLITGRYFSSLPSFKHFEDLTYEVGASSALSLLLKPDKLIETERTYDQPTNLYAEQVIGKEAGEYLYFLLAFPWYEIPNWYKFNIKEAFDIWSFYGNENSDNSQSFLFLNDKRYDYLTYNSSKRDFLKKVTLFNIFCRNFVINEDGRAEVVGEGESSVEFSSHEEYGQSIYRTYFINKKAALKMQQEKKINFLVALRDALVQEVIASNAVEFYESERFKKYVERFNQGSVFKIADTTAYPDIDLPRQYLSGKSINVFSPDFYYFKPKVFNSEKSDIKAISKLIDKSVEFKKDLRESIVSNKPYEMFAEEPTIDNSSMLVSTNGSEQSLSVGGEKNLSFKSKVTDVDIETMSLNEVPFKPGSFSDIEQMKTYITRKKAEIVSAEKQLSSLRSCIGYKNFNGIISKEEIEERIKNAGSDQQSITEELSKLLGFHSKEINYNDPEELKKLASESNEMNMLNMGMAKAFPTFRFYLVEEDSLYSDKLTVYDDFFSYASVISFNVNTSRELPASTAQIVLQNVSGVLDGSKKEVLRDIDVDSRKLLSRKDDQVNGQIESIVLRPGVNAQLRAGYSSTCSELDILISGRITEIQHSNDGMTTNITLQSYGVELDSKIEKNLARNNEANKFYSTHQLLGSLILSTQLKHFGRIKTGKIFQDGENKSAALDNRMPNEESKFSYYYSNMFTRTLADNTTLIVYSALGAGLLRFGGGALASKFGIFKTGGAVARRIGARGYDFVSKIKGVGIGEAGKKSVAYYLSRPFSWTLSTAEGVFKAGRGIGNFFRGGMSPGHAWIRTKNFFGNLGAQRTPTFTEANKKMLDGILTQLKAGKAPAQLTKPERDLLAKVAHILDDGVKKKIADLLTKRGVTGSSAARRAAVNEARIIALAIRQEGMGFKLSGFSTRGLGVASEALDDIAAAATAYAPSLFSMAGLANAFGTYTRSIIQTAAVSFGAGITVGLVGLYLDAIYNIVEGTVSGVKDAFEHIFGEEEDDTLRILLSPQDDNLFLPSSDSYLRESQDEEEGFVSKIPGATYFGDYKLPALNVWRFGTGMVDTAAWKLGTLLGIYNGDETYIAERFKEFKSLFDSRLDISHNENIYFLKGQTIFNVFHEMTLRHPGYVYGARPYGDSMEYRMFFGLPSQRYWAEDISTIDAIRVNKILRDYTKDPEGLLSYNTCKIYYPEATRRLEEGLMWTEYNTVYKKVAGPPSLTEEIKKRIRFEITKEAMHEYISKTKKRFIPFRKMHQINSSRNLIANNVIVSSHNVINTVSVNYTTLDSNGNEIEKSDDGYRSMYSLNLSANTAIPPEKQRPKTFSSENIVGPAAAYRYAIGQLIYGGKEMYQGSVLTLGNPKINPWDVLIINDDVNRMYGPVEVKAVNHMFSHEYGFLTDVEVNALVTFGEDSLTYPTIMSSILGQAKEQIFNRFASRALFEEEFNQDPEFYEDILETIVDDTIGDNASENFKKELIKALVTSLGEEMDKAKRESRPFFLRDVLENDIAIPDSLSEDLSDVGFIGLDVATFSGIVKFIKYKIHQKNGLLQKNLTGVRGPFGIGWGAFMAGSAFLAFGSDAIKDNVEGSLNSGRLGKNLFRPVLMSKVSNQSIIEVYPLVKDGKPLVAGGFEGVPASQSYQNILGNIYPVISDGIKGYIKYRDRLDKEGAESLYSFDEDFIQRKPSPFQIYTGAKNPPIVTKMITRMFSE